MNPSDIIKRPLVTEKAVWQATHEVTGGPNKGKPINRYTFEVSLKARKAEIKDAVESLYKVKVTKVRTQVRKGEESRGRAGVTTAPSWKRALVDLAPESKIELPI